MEEPESVIDALLEEEEEGEYLDDVEMVDAEASPDADAEREPAAGDGGDGLGRESGGSGKRKGKKRRKKKKNRRSNRDSEDYNVTDVNRFVINTCRCLKEKKSYLVWNAVGCLGLPAVSDLVKEVEAIQACGGQQTADGKRSRTAGGILWNILKTREPKAYKEIMAKGREFEKQFQKSKPRKPTAVNEKLTIPQSLPLIGRLGDKVEEEEHAMEVPTEQSKEGRVSVMNRIGVPLAERVSVMNRIGVPLAEERVSVMNRIRFPVAYDDLFEEGEIA